MHDISLPAIEQAERPVAALEDVETQQRRSEAVDRELEQQPLARLGAPLPAARGRA
jgi:hypothetical protein